MILGSNTNETAWSACESVIRRFEDAWRENARPDVGDFCTPDSPYSGRLLIELVHIDLEFRLRAGDCARAEDYLGRFPELYEPAALFDLLAAEFGLRNRHAPPAWPEEFWLRFPEYTTELRRRLPSDAANCGTGWFAVTRPAERAGAPLASPPIISGYEIQGELGRGGMGVVYKARDLILHRTVAVKTFATVPRPESCTRFAREAESIARLDHPNIVPVYEVGEWRAADGGPAVPFFVMKWYSGGSMDAAPAGRGTDARAQAKAVEVIARAVHHAHQRGVLHRDLKPSNILLDDAGRPHVADFGLAGRVEPGAQTVTAVIVGTPSYMAPEQARTPKQVSTAADVYGLGAILYQRLTGRPPFEAETSLSTLDLVANAVPERPSTINPAVTRDLDTICLKCLEKDPAQRYASAADLADDLERWRHGLPIAARPARKLELAWRGIRRHPFVTALVCTTLASLVIAVAVLAERNEQISEKKQRKDEAYQHECAMRYQLQEALTREQAASRQLEETIRREQRALYLERISAAGRLYAANQLGEAWALLDLCPEPYRGWEWNYLDSLRRAKTLVLAGHTVPVSRAEFLADGRLVSAETDGFIRVWDVAGAKTERTWTSGALNALAAHPKKHWIATADARAATVRNADTGRTIGKFDGANWIAFSPDGKTVATADKSTIRLWVVPEDEPKAEKVNGEWVAPPVWELVSELGGLDSFLHAGTFTPDGKQLVTSSIDRTVCLWDLETGKQVSRRKVPTPVTGLAVALQGKVLAEAHYGAVIFTDLATGQLRERLEYPVGELTAVVSSPDQRTVAVSGASGEVVVWDVARQRPTRTFRGHAGRVSALAFGPGGLLASGGVDRTVRVWDANSEQGVRTLAWVGDGVGGVAVSPDGAHVAVGPRMTGAFTDSKVQILDAATGEVRHRFPCWSEIGFHSTSGRLVTSQRSGGVSLRDPVSGAEIWKRPFSAPRQIPTGSAPHGRWLALAPDGSLLALWDRRAGGIELWNPADGRSLGVLSTGDAFVHELTLSPDASRLVAATSAGLQMWDIPTRTRLPWGEGPSGAIAVCFSPNGKWVASADGDRTVLLRDAATGREVQRFVGTTLGVQVLCFAPDGTRLVTGGADRTVRVWDVESGRELISLPGVTDGVSGLAWDAKNSRIYALDHAVRVWSSR